MLDNMIDFSNKASHARDPNYFQAVVVILLVISRREQAKTHYIGYTYVERDSLWTIPSN